MASNLLISDRASPQINHLQWLGVSCKCMQMSSRNPKSNRKWTEVNQCLSQISKRNPKKSAAPYQFASHFSYSIWNLSDSSDDFCNQRIGTNLPPASTRGNLRWGLASLPLHLFLRFWESAMFLITGMKRWLNRTIFWASNGTIPELINLIQDWFMEYVSIFVDEGPPHLLQSYVCLA
jgi:hypothetical protein